MKEAAEKAKQSEGIAGILSLRKKSAERAAGLGLVWVRNTEVLGFKLHLGKVILWRQQEAQEQGSPL